ncbi:STAS domain-containing protein [Thauera sinica]|uniref:STAS domain-containing protein n=1 Tax=Thauera sinica TaxID=2665146 RepID=A0ABW1ATG2_9RHOO|nr:STAS domain-containing protein [Thauera sp. K11]ATE61315.1 sulfate transporter [Thauera sp. K11]
MVLSFFGKKPPTGPSQRGTGTGADDRADESQPPRTELSSLNFGGIDASHALAQVARMVEVQESETGVGAAAEEAAVLYANGDVAEAERTLEAALDDPSTIAGDGLWLMLLDLYRLTGQKQRFEARVLDYATHFERSPPPWADLSPQAERRDAGVAPMVNLSGRLSAQAAAQFQQIGIIGRKSGAIRIDLGRVRGADEAGCALLRQALAALAADRVKVALLNCGPLADSLAGQTAPGRAEGRDVWLLLLDLLQYGADEARFENLAIDYAVTFEESPPSWEGRAAQAPAGRAAAATVPAGDAGADDVFRFDAELAGASNDTLRALAAFGAERTAIIVDCARLRRIDFVCAGTLFNILSTLRAQGRLVTLQNVNAMVGALLRVMNVDQVAHVTLRD